VGAAIKEDSVPERALLKARSQDVIALSSAVEVEIMKVLHRPKFARSMTAARRDRVLGLIRDAAVRFEARVRVTDCRDAKDNKYLELALAANAATIVASDADLLVLDPWRGIRILRPGEYLVL
jgi:putative PIN family toxin of toxin-antitoxin system